MNVQQGMYIKSLRTTGKWVLFNYAVVREGECVLKL